MQARQTDVLSRQPAGRCVDLRRRWFQLRLCKPASVTASSLPSSTTSPAPVLSTTPTPPSVSSPNSVISTTPNDSYRSPPIPQSYPPQQLPLIALRQHQPSLLPVHLPQPQQLTLRQPVSRSHNHSADTHSTNTQMSLFRCCRFGAIRAGAVRGICPTLISSDSPSP